MSLRVRKEKERKEKIKRYIVIVSIAAVVLPLVVYYARETGSYKNSRVWGFDSYEKGIIPEGFLATDTSWAVVRDEESAYSKPNVIEHNNKNKEGDGSGSGSNYAYSLLINSEGTYNNFKASVKVKVASNNNGSAGLVFRFVDSSHYFVALLDVSNNKLSLCRAEPARLLCLQDVNVDVESNKWYTLTVQASTQGIVCYLNDKPLIKRYDQHYIDGMIGLWARNDTIALFDDLEIYY
jgi:hypothetical protein